MTDRKKLRDRADALWSAIVKARDKWCVLCGRVTDHAHHIAGRGNDATRFDPENGVGVCVSCHDKDKTEPENFRDLLLAAIGADRVYRMEEKARQIMHFKNHDLREILEGLKRYGG